MYVIHEKCDCVVAFLIHQIFLLSLLHELMVKLDQQERLVLDIGEEVVFTDEIKHI